MLVLSIMVPHFPAIGSGGVPPVPPTILMSGMQGPGVHKTSILDIRDIRQNTRPKPNLINDKTIYLAEDKAFVYG